MIFRYQSVGKGRNMIVPSSSMVITDACYCVTNEYNAHINVNPVGGGGGGPGQYRGFDDKTHPLPGTFSNLPCRGGLSSAGLEFLMRMSSDA